MTKASSSKGGGSSDVNAAGQKVVQKPISTFFGPVEPVANGGSPGPSDHHHSKENGAGRSPAPLQAEQGLDLDALAKPFSFLTHFSPRFFIAETGFGSSGRYITATDLEASEAGSLAAVEAVFSAVWSRLLGTLDQGEPIDAIARFQSLPPVSSSSKDGATIFFGRNRDEVDRLKTDPTLTAQDHTHVWERNEVNQICERFLVAQFDPLSLNSADGGSRPSRRSLRMSRSGYSAM
jgi:hypothetical protein